MNSSQSKLIKVILASLVLHASLVYLIAKRQVFSQSVSVIDSNASTLIEPIKARLVFAPIHSNDLIQEQAVTQPPNTPPVTKADVTTTSKKMTPPLPASAAPATVPGIAINNKRSPALTLRAGEMAKQQLRGFQQQQLEILSQRATRAYQQQKNSPVLKGKKLDPFVTEDELLQASTRVTINCSSGANEAASTLSFLFGGTLKCSQPPPIKAFIQNRLHKIKPVPAKYTPVEVQ